MLLLAVAQLVLPGIAADRLRERLQRSGHVLEVEVKAFPAIELLWHQADSVVVRMANYGSSSGPLSSLVGQVADVGSLDASADQFQVGPLILHDATLRKRGNSLTGSATVTESDLRGAVPFLVGVTPVASSGGTLTLRGTASAFGLSATIDATVAAQNGRLVIAPDVPFGGLATITLFSNPALFVQGVNAQSTPGGFTVAATATLR